MSESNTLHSRSLIIGLVLGALVASIGFFLYGERAKERVASATEKVGDKVQDVGKQIERTGEKLK